MSFAAPIPGPKSLPIVGHLPWLMRDPLLFLTHLGRTYGDIATFRIGPRPVVLINHPELIDQVVRDTGFLRSAQTRDAMASFLGHGLFSLEGQPHLRHRRLMQPAFRRQRLDAYAALMASVTHDRLATWRPETSIDLGAELMGLTFAIVAKTLFDTDSGAEARAVNGAMRQILPWVTRLFRLSFVLPDGAPIVHTPATRAEIAGLQRLVRRIVAERRAAGGDRGDLLSMLLAARDEDGSALSDDEVCAEVLTILLAGHETTANTLGWACYLLTRHPEVQQRLADELAAAVGERPVAPDDLPRLPFLDQVVRETLRLFPPAWWADRVPQEDATLGGYGIPAQTPVVFSTYVTQRDPRFFPRPDTFDPDRFLPERREQITQGAYLPFGAGVHVCIGNRFALREARIILAAIVQRFALEAVPGHRVQPEPLVTLGMKGGFPVRLRGRAPAGRV